MAEAGFTVGIDLGGTKILVALIDRKGRICGRAKKKTRADLGVGAVLTRIVKTVEKLLKDTKTPASRVDCIGIGAAGPINSETGVIHEAPNLPFANLNIKVYLEKALKKPVFVANDVNAGTWGEYVLGAGQGAGSCLGVFVGTGIGAGLVFDHGLYEGAGHLAGEIGHICLNPNGPVCGCGRKGCVEAYASRTAMTREVWAAIDKGQKSVLSEIVEEPGGQIRSSELKQAYDAGDRLARKVVDEATDWLGVALGGVANLLNPERIVLGGGVVEAFGQPYVDRVREVMREHCFKSVFETTVLAPAQLGDDAGIIGAALLARHNLERAKKQKEAKAKAKAKAAGKKAKIASKTVKKAMALTHS